MNWIKGWFSNRKVIPVFVDVVVYGEDKKKKVKAKVDTGAYRTSIDEKLATQLGLMGEKNILYYKKYRNALGRDVERPVVKAWISISGVEMDIEANVTDRSHMIFPVLIGRRNLEKFTIEYDSSSDPEN